MLLTLARTFGVEHFLKQEDTNTTGLTFGPDVLLLYLCCCAPDCCSLWTNQSSAPHQIESILCSCLVFEALDQPLC